MVVPSFGAKVGTDRAIQAEAVDLIRVRPNRNRESALPAQIDGHCSSELHAVLDRCAGDPPLEQINRFLDEERRRPELGNESQEVQQGVIAVVFEAHLSGDVRLDFLPSGGFVIRFVVEVGPQLTFCGHRRTAGLVFVADRDGPQPAADELARHALFHLQFALSRELQLQGIPQAVDLHRAELLLETELQCDGRGTGDLDRVLLP